MNERIKELIEQAGFEEKDGHISIQGVYMFNTTRMEKFAELIVRECLGIIDEEGSHEGGSIRSMEVIKQRFGVEE